MIFDFHCHFSPQFFRYREYTMDLDALVAELDRHGVEQAALGPQTSAVSGKMLRAGVRPSVGMLQIPSRPAM
jgi:hypothetical protein